MVKTLPSNAGDTGSVPGRGAETHMLCGKKTKLKTEVLL